jgi:hypothetical protein
VIAECVTSILLALSKTIPTGSGLRLTASVYPIADGANDLEVGIAEDFRQAVGHDGVIVGDHHGGATHHAT